MLAECTALPVSGADGGHGPTEPPASRRQWAGALDMGPGWAVWRGAVGDSGLHRHFAAQAVLAPEPIGVADAGGRVSHACCILIDPLAAHQLSIAPQAELVFVEPSQRTPPDVAALLAPVRTARRVHLVRRPGAPSFWCDWLSRADMPLAIDTRVNAARRAVDAALPEPLSLTRAAASAGLSVERFRHLFVREVGLTYGRYILWGRLRLAAAELVAGRDATTAAHAAGFADAAHFARTLKSTFGVTASQTLLAARAGA